MASLVFRTIISIPGSFRRRTSVSVSSGVKNQYSAQKVHGKKMPYRISWPGLRALPRVEH